MILFKNTFLENRNLKTRNSKTSNLKTRYIFFFLIILIVFFVIPFIFGYSEIEANVNQIYQTPNLQHWFGTDHLGRDLFKRIYIGGQLSILIGMGASIISLCVGTTFGIIAAWNGGWLDTLITKFVDVLASIPYFILISIFSIIVMNQLSGFDLEYKVVIGLILSLGLTHWFFITRQVRLFVMQIKTESYLEAATALGAKPLHIIIKHILPALAPQLTVLVIAQLPSNILFEGVLGIMGLGVQAPLQSWGQLIQEGWKNFSIYPHIVIFPSLFIFLITLSVQVLHVKTEE